MAKQIIGAQGEITIIKLDALPECQTKPIERVTKGYIISHSESGHHHVLTGGNVMERTSDVPAGMKILYAILDEPQSLVQDAAGNPHKSFNLDPGFYAFKIAREFDPFAQQARRVAD